MSMQHIICPHCGHDTGVSAVNDSTIMSPVTRRCSNCHENFKWQGKHGKVSTSK